MAKYVLSSSFNMNFYDNEDSKGGCTMEIACGPVPNTFVITLRELDGGYIVARTIRLPNYEEDGSELQL